MKKQLFFDDYRIFGRNNTKRVYGKCEIAAIYSDGVCSTDFASPWIFRLDNGKYRMIYFGHSKEFSGKKLFSAISDDGINFVPEALNLEDTSYPHEIMTLPRNAEVAFIYEDKTVKTERYKLLMSEPDWKTLFVNDVIYTSSDLLHWTKKEGVFWGEGTEPLVSIFYNEKKNCHTIVERPYWGIRTVGQKETFDFKEFTKFRHTLGVDSEDEELAEIYGMFAFEYDGAYIGIPMMYRGLKSEYSAKYQNGIIDTQLAYSEDGEYWHRSLKKPFITGGEKYPIVWIMGMSRIDGNVYFYGAASELEHGPAFRNPSTGKILIWRMREDGFIGLESDKCDEHSYVVTREKLWHGGELSINLEAKSATVAVYMTNAEVMASCNVLGIAEPVEGYSHEDCIEFSGDSTSFCPKYKSGKTIDELKGKTIVFEIRFTNGTVYSISGDYTDLFNTEGARFRKLGALPE